MRFFLSLPLVLFIGCGGPSSTEAPPELESSGSEAASPNDDEVAFTFDWPEGMHARVRCDVSTTSSAAPGGQVRVLWNLSVEHSGDAVRVLTTDVEVSEIEATIADNDLGTAMAAIETFMPSMEVGADGRFRGVIDASTTSAALEEAVRGALPEAALQSPNWPVLQRGFSEAMLMQVANNMWMALVEPLAGRSVATTGQADSPVVTPAGVMAMGAETHIARDVDCGSNAAERCVRVEARSDAPDDFLSGINEQMPEGGPRITALAHRSGLVVDPSTLRPFHYTLVRETQFEQGISVREVRERTCTFDYEP